MPQVILTRNALNDLSRLKAFLQTKNPEAAKEAVITIRSHLKELATTPLAHVPDDERPDFRILIIPLVQVDTRLGIVTKLVRML
jgi:plasmid stabilization system protein ParE